MVTGIGTPTPIPSELKTPEVLERARSLPVGEGITERRPTSGRGRVSSAARARAQAEARARQAKEVAQAKVQAAQKAKQVAQSKLRQAKIDRARRTKAREALAKRESLPTLQQVRAMAEVQLAPKSNFIQRQERERERLRTKQQRGQKLTLKEEAILASRTSIQAASEFGTGFVMLPISLFNLARNPSQIKNIPKAISEGGQRFGRLLRTSPTEAFVQIGTEVFLMAGTGKAIKLVGKVGSKATTRLNPKFKGIKKGSITIPSTTRGKDIKIKVGGTVKKIAEPISKQARLAGKRTTAVSAQADRLVNFLRGKRIVRKPIPNEATFSKPIKKLLKRFDDGTITKKELVKLESQVPVLERSFFADPKGRFRPSRLGIGKQKEASLLDILSGDVTFKTSKPQILVFENIKVQRFPKALKDVEKALKGGKTLTKSQAKRLLRFQQEKTGKFKPIGALTKEPEITLAPGEIIKKVKKVGVTLVDGKKVEIVQAKVIKASKTTSNLLKKSKKGKLTAKELKTLSKKLTKETGFKSSLSRSTKLKPRARIPKVVPRARAVTRIKRVGRFVKGSPEAKRFMRKIREARRPTPRITGRVTTRVPPRRPPSRPPRRPPRRPPKRPPSRPPLVPPIRKPTKILRKKKPTKKPVQVFDVFGKSKGKFVKLNPKPLKRGDALSKGAFAIDRTTARTFKIVPKGKTKTPGKLLKSERNYFNRQGFKLREVRIKKGRKFQLKRKYIEKTKHLIDTKSEKGGLTVAKLLQERKSKRRLAKKRAVRRTVRRKNTKRVTRVPLRKRTTSAQRKVMLRNLRKARRVRMKKLKGGKRK